MHEPLVCPLSVLWAFLNSLYDDLLYDDQFIFSIFLMDIGACWRKVICLLQFPQCPPPHTVSHSKTHPEHILHGYCFHTNYHHLRYNKNIYKYLVFVPSSWSRAPKPLGFLRDTVSSVTHKKLLLTTTDLMLTRWLLVASPGRFWSPAEPTPSWEG